MTDYAEPADLPSRAGPDRPAVEVRPWGGRGRRALQWVCAGSALLLAVVLTVVLAAQRPGAESPQAAVDQLLRGIADLDAPAIVGVVAPAEVADPQRADDAYTRLGDRVRRQGEVPPVEVDRVLLAAEQQLGGSAGRQALAVLAAVDLELDGLDLEVEQVDADTARVSLLGGVLSLAVDPGRLPGDAVIDSGAEPAGSGDAGRAGPARYDMAVAEGWRRDDEEVVASLVVVRVDERWYVSLEATADDLLGAP